MKIVADENIVSLADLFAPHGEVISLPGRKITAADVKNADVLLVRSVTTVNKELLQGSAVKFVGSCTIGTDHLDTAWLEQQGIHWEYAPGCNANAVVDYVMASMLALNLNRDKLNTVTAAAFTVGIVGCGNVGSRLQKRLDRLGVKTLCCDPPLAEKKRKGKHYFSLAEVLSQSDMVCLHTPLTTTGAHPTFHLINENNLPLLKHNAILLNAGRGAVVDSQALLVHMNAYPEFRVALDVWENEPKILKALLAKAVIATPHIAGYSVEGKQRGSEIIYKEFCKYFSITPAWAIEKEEAIILDARQFKTLRELVLACYDPLKDSEELKHTPEAFDQLRKLYVYRREFSQFRIRYAGTENRKTLKALGF
jgi:erythronate-4-phosphate dehydrogenase